MHPAPDDPAPSTGVPAAGARRTLAQCAGLHRDLVRPRRGATLSQVAQPKSLSIPDQEWALARGAYVVAHQIGEPVATFPEWVWRAAQAFALRTRAERLTWLEGLDPSEVLQTQTVAFDQDVLDLIDDAMLIDKMGPWRGSRSRWLRAALQAHVAHTSELVVGPIAPLAGRLPVWDRAARRRR